jgi:hypothetical protein
MFTDIWADGYHFTSSGLFAPYVLSIPEMYLHDETMLCGGVHGIHRIMEWYNKAREGVELGKYDRVVNRCGHRLQKP